KPEGSNRTKARAMGMLPDSKDETEKLLRLLTPVIKMCCSLRSVEGLRACMESLGGVGYCENNEDSGALNIARLFRDANVNPIWEGTGSVLAEDLLRALKVGKKEAKQEFEEVFGKWVMRVVSRLETLGTQFEEMVGDVKARYEKLRILVGSRSEDELLWQGRVVVGHFEAIVCAMLLMSDAAVDADNIAYNVAERWVRTKVKLGVTDENIDWRKEVEMDRRIFLGDQD
ncbi:MAG: hypothetical protein M1823_006808, partial [Watsoniomyces obsoletus]